MTRRALMAAAAVMAVAVTALLVWRALAPAPDLTTPEQEAARAEVERLREDIEAQRAAGVDPGVRLAGRLGFDFTHAQHRTLECLQCHSVQQTHGALRIADVRQCRECHHSPPHVRDCTQCHRAADFSGERRPVQLTFRPSVSPPVTRDLVFSHAQHAAQACTSCHVEPVTMAVTGTCRDCHIDHHQPQHQCLACHVTSPRGAHTVAAHVSCTGAGCHDPLPAAIAQVPRTRQFCLACHQDLVDHERGLNCADCHRLPPPRTAAAAEAAQ